ncbi:MAG: hypothetical protein WC575_00060 [Patescibacteria group bacterium]
MNQEINDYITKRRIEGTSDSIIKQSLKEVGWTEVQLINFFPNIISSSKKPRSKVSGIIKVVLIVLASLIVCFIFVARYWSQIVSYSKVFLPNSLSQIADQNTVTLNDVVKQDPLAQCNRKTLPVFGELFSDGVNPDNCYFKFALEKKDVLFCDMINDNSIIIPYCYQGVAIMRNNAQLCDLLNNRNYGDKVEACKRYVTDFNSGSTVCKEGDDTCSRNIGVSTLDLGYCRRMVSSYHSKSCMSQVVEIKPDDVKVCLEFTELFDKDKCYTDFATAEQSVDLCSRVEVNDRRSQCLITVAVDKGDQTVCDKLDKYHRGSCYLNFPQLQDSRAGDIIIKSDIGDYKFEEYYQYNKNSLVPEMSDSFIVTYVREHIPLDQESIDAGSLITEYEFQRVRLSLAVYKNKADADIALKKNYLDQFPGQINKKKIGDYTIYTAGSSGGAVWTSNNVWVSIDAENYITYDQAGGITYPDQIMPVISAYLNKYPPALSNLKDEMDIRDTQRISDIRWIQTVLIPYFDDNNGYPRQRLPVVLGSSNASSLTNNGWGASGTTMYLAEVPSDPQPFGQQYTYCSANLAQPEVCADSTQSYIITFRLETDTDVFGIGTLSAGVHTATPNGIK